ncbi:MAG: polysaccharide deacetylase family protein [Coprobacillus sp.]
MKIKLKKKNLYKDLGLIVAIIAIICVAFFLLNRPVLSFSSDNEIEINSVVDYTRFIENLNDEETHNVVIDSSQVKIDKLGEYEVIYKYKDDEVKFTVEVVDKDVPVVKTKEKTIVLNSKIEAKEFIEEIKDATKTTTKFAKNYKFDSEGQQEIEVIVTDEGGNETVSKVIVHVEADKIAPVITGGNANFIVGSKVELKELIKVKDNYDPHPSVVVESDGFDANKIGSYNVKYIVTDSSNNKSEKSIIIHIVDKTASNSKVVYLTFDDGPSKFTPDVLKILDKYNCKATFFVTGMNSSYRKYIKEAHDSGHTIGLHTYSHNYSKVYSSTDAYFEDLNKIGNMVKDYIGYFPKYIRFPGGSSNAISKKYSQGIMTKLTKMVTEKGYKFYDWNAENGDGFSNVSKAEMLKRATASSANEIMMLMHDANGKQDTVDLLPQIIEHYQQRGYVFKAIDDSSIVPHQKVNN